MALCFYLRSTACSLASDASNEILQLRTFDTGQLALASATISWNLSLVTPGTVAFTIKCDCVIAPFSKVISHVVSKFSGVRPAAPNTKLSFIVKQPAWAAAINSSGLVPTPCSKRVPYEYCALLNTVLWVLRRPLPSLPPPFQFAVAVLFMALVLMMKKQ